MLKVGITGGMGSGKSTVAKVFAVLGAPVYNADDAAKWLMNSNAELKLEIVAAFGAAAYTHAGLNRPYLSEKVFGDAEKLRQLNALVHPKVIAHALQWMAAQRAPYALKEAALMFESGSQTDLDLVIGVYAPEALRIKRTMLRDATSAEAAKARMAKQLDERIKMKLCDAVVLNDDSRLVVPQVLALHKRLMALSVAPPSIDFQTAFSKLDEGASKNP
jgi:dephospho-CoA kinase